MYRSHLTHREWAIGSYLYTASIKGVSPMRLHRELGISRKSAWFLMHRLRKASETGEALFADPLEADETQIGGKRKNKPNAECKNFKSRGPVGVTAVAGVKGRESNKVIAKVVERTDKETSRGLVEGQAQEEAQICTDDAKAFVGIDRPHEAANHSVSECVWNVAHTNGMESFMAMLNREHDGIHRKRPPKHLEKHVNRFANRRDIREKAPVDRMGDMVRGIVRKRLQFSGLIAVSGPASGARS